MVLAKDAPANRGSSAPERLNSLGISQAYYTENQAERGKAYFYAACGVCQYIGFQVESGPVHWRNIRIGTD